MINIDEIPKQGGVYKIISPNKKIYIGRTKNLRLRFQKYSKLHCERQNKLYNSFIKYGFENHSLEILVFSDSNSELNELEILFIKQYDSFYGKNGLNLTEGGDGMRKKHSEKTKNKISESLKNSEKHKSVMNSKEYKDKLSRALIGHEGYGKGKKRTEKDIENIKNGIKKHFEENPYRKHTEQSKLKMSENRKDGNNNNAKRRIISYEGNIIEFNCQKHIKTFFNNLNLTLKLSGPNRFSYDGLIKKGKTNSIVLLK
jgi:hypothetical protein